MKKKTSLIVSGILVVIILICLIFIGRHYLTQKQNEKVYDNLASEVQKTQTEQKISDVTTETEEQSTIDFNALWDVNPDIYAWIEIPGTQVAYPVLRKEGDDDYYLNVTVEGNSGLPGSIYSQASYNGKDFQDFNTILYGHDMKDGSIFGGLKNYRDASYWTDHPEMIIYTPDQKLTYKIFAAVVYSNDLIPYKYDLNTDEGKQQFLDSVYSNSDSRSIIDKDAVVTTQSRLLTLSTCIGNETEHRYLVIGVLENQ